MTADERSRHRVAILSEPGLLRDLTQQIVLDEGWLPEIIEDRDLERPDAPVWPLIIIADEKGSRALAQLGAKASRHPSTRALAISTERDSQHVADVLRAGVDDYLIAPFDPKELRARMRALVTRSGREGDKRRFQLVFDFSRRTIVSGPMMVSLPPREWDALIALLEAEGRPVSVSELEQLVWDGQVHRGTVVSTVSRICRRFEQRDFRVIQISTVRGAGYRAVFRRAADSLPPRGQTMSSAISRPSTGYY